MKKLYLLIALAAIVAAVNAAVFVYYPLTVNVRGTTAEVRFAPGSNADQPDLAGRTIAVTLEGSYNTKVTVTVNPTNERTYYRDVLWIENYGVNRYYYAWINVTQAISSSAIISAKLYVKDGSGNVVATIDLKQTGIQPASPNYITIPPATQSGTPPNVVTTPGRLYIDIEIQIDRNVNAGTVSDTAVLELIYSRQYTERP